MLPCRASSASSSSSSSFRLRLCALGLRALWALPFLTTFGCRSGLTRDEVALGQLLGEHGQHLDSLVVLVDDPLLAHGDVARHVGLELFGSQGSEDLPPRQLRPPYVQNEAARDPQHWLLVRQVHQHGDLLREVRQEDLDAEPREVRHEGLLDIVLREELRAWRPPSAATPASRDGDVPSSRPSSAAGGRTCRWSSPEAGRRSLCESSATARGPSAPGRGAARGRRSRGPRR